MHCLPERDANRRTNYFDRWTEGSVEQQKKRRKKVNNKGCVSSFNVSMPLAGVKIKHVSRWRCFLKDQNLIPLTVNSKQQQKEKIV